MGFTRLVLMAKEMRREQLLMGCSVVAAALDVQLSFWGTVCSSAAVRPVSACQASSDGLHILLNCSMFCFLFFGFIFKTGQGSCEAVS